MSNRICELFGIEYPVVMGGVARTPELGAAVSNAGGLGCIQGITPPEFLREQIRKFRDLTDKPFSVNFPIVLTPPEHLEEKMQMMIDEKVPVVMSSAGNPKLWTQYLKDGGVKVAHVLPTVYHAKKAMEAGVDAIIAEPAESGGYRGDNEVSMMVLIPAIHRAFPEMPLVAAGAVADGVGMSAVMALGADAVQLGTRFIASVEAEASEPVRKLILAAIDTSTESAEGRVRPRVSKKEFAMEVLGKEQRVQMGQVSALIDEIKTVEAIMRDLMEGGVANARQVAEDLAAFDVAKV
jgi:enoyl-[acyl-carrier protein] reductase II